VELGPEALGALDGGVRLAIDVTLFA